MHDMAFMAARERVRVSCETMMTMTVTVMMMMMTSRRTRLAAKRRFSLVSLSFLLQLLLHVTRGA